MNVNLMKHELQMSARVHEAAARLARKDDDERLAAYEEGMSLGYRLAAARMDELEGSIAPMTRGVQA